MKHPTQDLDTSRAYIVCDNCRDTLVDAEHPNKKTDLPLSSNLAVVPYHLLLRAPTEPHGSCGHIPVIAWWPLTR